MRSFIDAFFSIFKYHKSKIFLTFFLAVIFAFWLFPFGDLNDYVTAKISEITGGVWFVESDALNVGFLPAPSLTLDNVLVDGVGMKLKTDRLSVSPWVMGALTAKQGASIDANGLFGGSLVADYREGDKMKSGEREKQVAVEARGIKLQLMSLFLRDGGMLNMALTGLLNISSQLNVDPLFDRQPAGSVGIDISGLTLPSQTMSVDFNGSRMPLLLPEVRLGTTKLDAKLNEGEMQIQSLTFGSSKDDVSGNAKGQVSMGFKRDNAGVHPNFGAYDLRVNLLLKKEYLSAIQSGNLGIIFTFIDKFRHDTAGGISYAFRVKGTPFTNPDFSSIQ
jgi:type II secretion system protein N